MSNIIQVEFNSETAPAGFEVTRIEQKQQEYGDVMAQPGRHYFYMIMYITEGVGVHEIDFKKYDLQEGDLVFLAKGQVQAFEKNSSLKGYGLLFTETYLSKFSGQSSIMANHRLFNYHLNNPVLRLNNLAQQAEFEALFAAMEMEFNNSRSAIRMEVLYHQLQILLLKSDEVHGQRLIGPVSQESYGQFVQFKNVVDRCLKKTRAVSFYADEMKMSPKKLNALINKVTGQNTKDYLIALTILEIKRTLISKGNSIKEVSFEMGFEEPTNMVKFFKKNTSLTPKEFLHSLELQ